MKAGKAHFSLIYLSLIFFYLLSGAPRTAIAQEGFKLHFPVNCVLHENCFVASYFDLDTQIGYVTDFTCGDISKDNQKGTHIILQDFKDTALNFFVLAAADGEVIAYSDGLPDLVIASGDVHNYPENPCGNGIVLEHDGGWTTRYCHLKNNSLLVKLGDKVKKGQAIARIGSSGQTDWPKLDFSVAQNGYLFDPFSGKTTLEKCGGTISPMWEQPLTYTAFAILKAGFNIGFPDQQKAEIGHLQDYKLIPDITPDLNLWAMLLNVRKGDIISLEILDPEGRIFNSYREEATFDIERHFVYLYTKKKNILWDRGLYTGIIRLERYQGAELHETFKTTTVQLYDQEKALQKQQDQQ